MKYLICTRPPGIYPKNIPVADFCNLVALYMKKKGHDVVLIYTHRKPFKEELKWLDENNLKWKMWADTHYYSKNIKYFFKLYKIIKDERPDMMEFQVLSAPFGLLASKILRVKYRIIWHHTLVHRNQKNFISKIRQKLQDVRMNIYFKLASNVIANSNETKKENIKHHKTDSNKITVQYLGTYLPDKKSESINRELMIVCIGRYVVPKGQYVLINSLPEIVTHYPDIKVIFIGSENPDWLIELATKLNVIGNCVFMGEQSREKIYEILKKASISVFPTLAEAFGLVAIDSLACGTPLIASRTGGLKDIIEENKNGILVEPGNVKELSNAIVKLLGDDKFLNELSRNAIERAEYFEIHTRAESYADWLTNISNGKNK